jgi:hypothetical protein
MEEEKGEPLSIEQLARLAGGAAVQGRPRFDGEGKIKQP